MTVAATSAGLTVVSGVAAAGAASAARLNVLSSAGLRPAVFSLQDDQRCLSPILNHPNFASPTNMLVGRSTQTLASGLGSGGANGGFNPLYQIGGPRSIQLALKLQF